MMHMAKMLDEELLEWRRKKQCVYIPPGIMCYYLILIYIGGSQFQTTYDS